MEVVYKKNPAGHCTFYDLEQYDELTDFIERGLARCVSSDDTSNDVIAMWDELRNTIDQNLIVPVPKGTVIPSVQKIINEFVKGKTSRLRRFAIMIKSKASNEVDIGDAVLRLNRLMQKDKARASIDCAALSIHILRKAGDEEAHCQFVFKKEADKENHVVGCPFRPVPCPNPGCGVTTIMYKLPGHDSQCPFKLLPCPQNCPLRLCRKDITDHVVTVCAMKPVTCPYNSIGCKMDVVLGSLADHLANDCDQHLWLAMARVEVQDRRIFQLEDSLKVMGDSLQRLQSDLVNQYNENMESMTKDLGYVRRDFNSAKKENTELVMSLQRDIKEWKGGMTGPDRMVRY